MRGKHCVSNLQPLEMDRAFRRDEFAAQLRARKLFLLDQQHARAKHCQMNRSAGACRAPAGDNHIVIIGCAHRNYVRTRSGSDGNASLNGAFMVRSLPLAVLTRRSKPTAKENVYRLSRSPNRPAERSVPSLPA